MKKIIILFVVLSFTLLAGCTKTPNELQNEEKSSNLSYQSIVLDDLSDIFKATTVEYALSVDKNNNIIDEYGQVEKFIEPSSIFRYIPLKYVIDNNMINNDTMINCTGNIENTLLKCYESSGHGLISMFDAISLSCVTGYNELSKLISKDSFCQWYGEKFKDDMYKFNEVEPIDIVMGRNFKINVQDLMSYYNMILNEDNMIKSLVKKDNVYSNNNVSVYRIEGISSDNIKQFKMFIFCMDEDITEIVFVMCKGIDTKDSVEECILSSLD